MKILAILSLLIHFINNKASLLEETSHDDFDSVEELIEVEGDHNRFSAVVVTKPDESIADIFTQKNSLKNDETMKNNKLTLLPLYLRKNPWRGCNRKAVRLCKRACKRAAKDACSARDCSRKLRKELKRQCKRSCKSYMKY